jgi:hypothetical protein
VKVAPNQKKVQEFDCLVKGQMWQQMKTDEADEEPLGAGVGRSFVFHGCVIVTTYPQIQYCGNDFQESTRDRAIAH